MITCHYPSKQVAPVPVPYLQEMVLRMAETAAWGYLNPAGLQALREFMRRLDTLMADEDARDSVTLPPSSPAYYSPRPWEDPEYVDLWHAFPDLV